MPQCRIDTGNVLWADGIRTLATITEATDHAEGVRRTSVAQFEQRGDRVVGAERRESQSSCTTRSQKLIIGHPAPPVRQACNARSRATAASPPRIGSMGRGKRSCQQGPRKRLLSYSENANLWPTDAVTRRGALERNLPRYARQLVLAAIEGSLIPSMAGNPELPSGLHVERLMPRGWEEGAWPLPSSIDREEAVAKREQAIPTLGMV